MAARAAAGAPCRCSSSEFAIERQPGGAPGRHAQRDQQGHAGAQPRRRRRRHTPPTWQPGESEDLDRDVAVGEYKVYCAIPGHEAGMVATINVAEGVEVAAGPRRSRRQPGTPHGSMGAKTPNTSSSTRTCPTRSSPSSTHSPVASPTPRASAPSRWSRPSPRRHQGVRHHRRDRQLGGRARQGRRRMDLQRHGARSDHPGRDRRQGAHRPQERTARRHRHPHPRHPAAQHQDGVSPVTQDPIEPGRRATPTSTRRPSRRSPCTTRTSTAAADPQRHVRGASSRRAGDADTPETPSRTARRSRARRQPT